ncbi:MAG: RluA family pseudouridine synthase [Pseudomonadota bacterium]
MDAPLVVTLPGDAPARLDKALARALPASAALSRSRLQALIAAGAVRRAGHPVLDPGARVAPGEVLTLEVPDPVALDVAPEAIPLDVVFEDEALIVVNKPAGLVVHPAPGAERGTLVNALLAHCGASLSGIGGARRPGIVHRLDKDTSGLLVVAKTDQAHQSLAAAFAEHSIDRQYRALVWGAPDAAARRLAGLEAVEVREAGLTIRAEIGRHPKDRKRMAVLRAGGRHAVTHLRVAGRRDDGAAAEVTCQLETGRTHQIRVHLGHIGHPLIGDPVYGRARRAPGALAGAVAGFERQALHAERLGFRHPVTSEHITFERPPPEDFLALHGRLFG